MHCSRVRGDWAGNWELKVHFLHFFETIGKSEFIISGTFLNSDLIFGTFPNNGEVRVHLRISAELGVRIIGTRRNSEFSLSTLQ